MDKTPIEWVIYCPTHKHYAKFVGITGVTWTADAAAAARYPTKRKGHAANRLATFADHRPIVWPVTGEGTRA